jgi:hypothetical protein
MVGAFTATSMAAEWNFYGSSRFGTFYTTKDPGNGGEDVNNLEWQHATNARIGANVKVNDQIGGRFEMGTTNNKRLLYGTYNFGGGELLVGQTYTPSVSFYSNSVYNSDGDLLNVGQFYNGRKEMIQLKMAGFKVALIKPNVIATGGFDTESVLPEIEGAYKFKGDNFFVDVYAGYQTYDLKGTPTGDETVDSYVVGGGAGLDFGPVFVKIGGFLAKNQENYGAGSGAATYDVINNKVVDNDAYGYLAVVGFKASDAFIIEAGYGDTRNEPDVDNSIEDETVQYYINLTWNIAPGFFVVPEIGYIDYKTDSNNVEQGDFTYAGLKWQINF